MGDFLKGARYAISGFGLITRPGIRLFVIVPFLVNTLMFSFLIYYGFSEFKGLVSWIEGQWQWLEWIGWLLWPIFFLLSLTLVFFCFTVVANLIAAPFNGILAEAVERELAPPDPGQGENAAGLFNMQEILAGLKSELRKFAYIMVRTLPLLFLFVVPFLQLIAPMIWILFAAWVMALEYIEYPLSNHGADFREVRAKIAEKPMLSLGFGLGVTLMTMIPLLNFLAMPVAVSGATRLYLEMLKSGT